MSFQEYKEIMVRFDNACVEYYEALHNTELKIAAKHVYIETMKLLRDEKQRRKDLGLPW